MYHLFDGPRDYGIDDKSWESYGPDACKQKLSFLIKPPKESCRDEGSNDYICNEEWD